MTTSAIKLTSPHELLAVVPYLLGFHPTRSLVLLCLSNNRIGLTQRLDLPENADDVASALLPSLITENPDAVILIGFEDQEDESLPALEALTTALQSRAMRIHDRIVVRGGRWRSLDCHSPSCCPPEGSPVPEPADVPGVISEFVGRGVAPHHDRESLARQVEAGPQAAAVATMMRELQTTAGCPTVPRADLFTAWPRILDPDGQDITTEDAALAAVSLLDIEIRDAMVAWLCPGTLAWPPRLAITTWCSRHPEPSRSASSGRALTACSMAASRLAGVQPGSPSRADRRRRRRRTTARPLVL